MKRIENLFVTLQTRKDHDGEYQIGYVTPDGTDAAALKRKDSARSWAKNYYGKFHSEFVMPNTPIAGFMISNCVKRTGWNGGNVVWRIVHPDGWEFEITSANLGQILVQTSIVKGSIPTKCYFVRDGAKNILVPVGTDLDAEVSVEIAKNEAKASLPKVLARTLQIGTVIQEKTKQLHEIVYLGANELFENIVVVDNTLTRDGWQSKGDVKQRVGPRPVVVFHDGYSLTTKSIDHRIAVPANPRVLSNEEVQALLTKTKFVSAFPSIEAKAALADAEQKYVNPYRGYRSGFTRAHIDFSLVN